MASWVVLGVCAVLAAWAVLSGGSRPQEPREQLAIQREQVTRAAVTHIASLATVNPATPKEDLARWQQATTGPLQGELARIQTELGLSRTAKGTHTEAEVGSAAVTALDLDDGNAQVIAVAHVRLVGGTSGLMLRKRYVAGLARTPDGWKIKSLTLVTAAKEATR